MASSRLKFAPIVLIALPLVLGFMRSASAQKGGGDAGAILDRGARGLSRCDPIF